MKTTEQDSRITATGGQPPVLLSGLAAAALVLTGAAAAAKTMNNVIARRSASLAPDSYAEEWFYDWPEGLIRYTDSAQQAASEEPLLLLHGFGLGDSSYEWGANVAPLSSRFRVYTYDALGFGRSAKPALHFTGELYVRLLRDFLRDVVGGPVNVVASGLAGAYATALACREPSWFRQVILVCPTGIQRLNHRPSPFGRGVYQTLSTPILGESCYNSLASHARIEDELRHARYLDGSRVTPEMVDHYWTAAHQPGARWPIRSLLAGYLNIDIREEFRRLERPVTLVWGQQARIPPLAHAEAFLQVNPDAELEIFSQAGAYPHEERAGEFNRLVEERLTTPAAPLELPGRESGG